MNGMSTADKGLAALGAFLLLAAALHGAVKGSIEIDQLGPVQAAVVAVLGTVFVWLGIQHMPARPQMVVVGVGVAVALFAYFSDESEPNTRIPSTAISAEASSTLSQDGDTTYDASNTIDGHSFTAWNDGVSTDGVGERLTYTFETPVALERISLRNGYAKGSVWKLNSRMRVIEIRTEKKVFEVTLEDTPDLQHIDRDFGETAWVELTVQEVILGSSTEWEPDVALSEIEFYGSAD